MQTYTITVPGARTRGGKLVGGYLGDLLHSLSMGAAGALRLRVEGRSTFRPSRIPRWLARGVEFVVDDYLTDVPGVVLSAPTLSEALPERFDQGDLFGKIRPDQSAFSLLSESFDDALAERMDSDAFDTPLLDLLSREFARLFNGDVSEISMSNGSSQSPRIQLTKERLRVVTALRDRTPHPRRVRLAGRIDQPSLKSSSFVLDLADGSAVKCVLIEGDRSLLKSFFGEIALVEGTAQFRPSGRLLRVDVQRVEEATPRDAALFSTEPRPLEYQDDLNGVSRPRPPRRRGLDAIIGQWPGDESDEELERMLHEMS